MCEPPPKAKKVKKKEQKAEIDKRVQALLSQELQRRGIGKGTPQSKGGNQSKERWCPECKSKAEEIILASENKRVGWWCRTCNHFQKAILRERTVA